MNTQANTTQAAFCFLVSQSAFCFLNKDSKMERPTVELQLSDLTKSVHF